MLRRNRSNMDPAIELHSLSDPLWNHNDSPTTAGQTRRTRNLRLWLSEALNTVHKLETLPDRLASTSALPTPHRVPHISPHSTRRRLRYIGIGCFLFLWLIYFSSSVRHQLLGSCSAEPLLMLSCGSEEEIWRGPNDQCGLDGAACIPQDAEGAVAAPQYIDFRCPARCARDSYTYTPRYIGRELVQYRSYIVGGNNTYRADSYVCAAGVHAGRVSNLYGGRGRIRLTYGSEAEISRYNAELGGNGIESVSFDSFFPAKFEFVDLPEAETSACRDNRAVIIAVNICFAVIFGYFVVPNQPGEGPLFFTVLVTIGFWLVALVADPPVAKAGAGGPPGDERQYEKNVAQLVSLAFERFLPTAFVCYVLWLTVVKPQLQPAGRAVPLSLSRAVFWIGGFFIGVLNNYTFDSLPIDRLTPQDIRQQPGALAAVAAVLAVVVLAFVHQIRLILRETRAEQTERAGPESILSTDKPLTRRFGLLTQLCVFYALVFIASLFLSALPHETLRIHHYILALILLPGTRTPNSRLSYLFQSILVGLFLSGVARWGFASIVETNDSLLRGGPGLSRGTQPKFLGIEADGILNWQYTGTGNVEDNDANTEDFHLLNSFIDGAHDDSIDYLYIGSHVYKHGYSLILNDIERYRGFGTEFSVMQWLDDHGIGDTDKVYVKVAHLMFKSKRKMPPDGKQFRFNGDLYPMGKSPVFSDSDIELLFDVFSHGDYTLNGVYYTNGTFIDPLPGAS